MGLSKATLDELTADCKTPGDAEKLFLQMLQHNMINRSLEAEMQARVGHAPHGRGSGNVRNGKSRKRVRSTLADLQIETPRDREGSFEPQLVKKRQVRLAGVTDPRNLITSYTYDGFGQLWRQISPDTSNLPQSKAQQATGTPSSMTNWAIGADWLSR